MNATNLGQGNEPIKVHLVNPPVQDPWRTQGDYLADQRRARKLYWVATAAMIVTAFGVVATSLIAMTTVRSYSEPARTIQVECFSSPRAPRGDK